MSNGQPTSDNTVVYALIAFVVLAIAYLVLVNPFGEKVSPPAAQERPAPPPGSTSAPSTPTPAEQP